MQPNYNFYGAYPSYQQVQPQYYNQLVMVNTLEEAQNYIVNSNKPIYFKVNSQQPLFVEKKIDLNTGNVIMETYQLVKSNNSTSKSVQYATLNDLEVLKQEVIRLQNIFSSYTQPQQVEEVGE